MSLFKKKKIDYNGNTDEQIKNDQNNNVSVKILGSGCSKCNELEANTIVALKQLNLHAIIEHITDFSRIAAYGIMSTPALVINEKVIAYGKVLKVEEIIKFLQ